MGKHEALARRIRELRQTLGWTQQDLAIRSGLSRSYISRLEMGDIALPSSERLRALSNSLGTTSDDLLTAAGFIDTPRESPDLPEIKVYLRQRYGIDDQRILQAVETIVNNLTEQPAGDNGADELAGRAARERRSS
jgi:transcriptional regulator with XRE-family HTH domain